RRGGGAAGAGPGAGRGGPGAGGRGEGRGRRGEIAARLGVRATAPDPGLAGARERLGLLREGHAVPAGGRVAEDVLSDPGARRPPGDSRTGGWEAPDVGPRPGATPDAAAGAAGCPSRGCLVGGPRPAAAPPADPRGGQTPAPPGEPGPAATPDLRGSSLDRLGDPGAARRPDRESADRASPAPRQLPA